MRVHACPLVCSVLLALSAGVVAAQRAFPLEGLWEGALAAEPPRGSREPGRRTPPPPSPVYFAISTAKNGTYSGTWLNSGAGAKGHGDIDEVAIDGDAVRIGVPSSRGVWPLDALRAE